MFDDIREETLGRFAALNGVSADAITRENTQAFIAAIDQHPEVQLIRKNQEEKLKEFIETLGVLCLSTTQKSILMWSHYADNHRGFCIGFKNNIGFNENDVMQVKYSESRENDLLYQYILTLDMNEDQKKLYLMREIILKKYIDWKYEEEWRIINKKGVKNYSDDHLDSIIFGLKMDQAHKRKILSI